MQAAAGAAPDAAAPHDAAPNAAGGAASAAAAPAAAQAEATKHLGFALQFVVEALRGGEGPALASRLLPMLPPLLQLQVRKFFKPSSASATKSQSRQWKTKPCCSW